MKIRHYCTKCKEVLCEKCKLQSKHASHADQIGDISSEAVPLRHRLTERLRNISPEDKEEEVEAGMKHAGDLIEAFGCDLQGKVADIKRLIHEHCDEHLHRIKQRKEELMNEAELQSKKLSELHAQTLAERNGVVFQTISKSSLRNEDLLKMHPQLTEVVTSSLQHLPKNNSRMRRLAFERQNLSGLEGILGSTGKVVDNTDIDLSRCEFSEKIDRYIGYVGEETKITALVNNWQGNPISEPALKVCSIQIWATEIQYDSAEVPVAVPISSYGEGAVHARFQGHEDGVFFLEICLDRPLPVPNSEEDIINNNNEIFKLGSFKVMATLMVYKSRAIIFDESDSFPRKFIDVPLNFYTEPCVYPYTTLRHIKDGNASIRALEPIQERYFAVAIEIVHCASSKLEIGFTWDCRQSEQKMKLLLASSAKKRSLPTPISGCSSGETIQISRSRESLDTYNIKHISFEYELIKEHNARIDAGKKPFLMVRMSHSHTCIAIYDLNSDSIFE